MATKNPKLPTWAAPHPTRHNTFLVDPDKFYPAFLAELDFHLTRPNKYCLEVCLACMKMDLQVALRRFDFEIHIRADNGRKKRWNHSMHPGDAMDVLRAIKAGEAREHYRRIRGFVPA